jgi:hypothetical protein
MRFEIILFIIVVALMVNVYTDGRLLKKIFSLKKYWQMAGILVGAFVLYYLIKKNPGQASQIIMTSNDYIKYLPIDSNTTSMLSPILDFTSKHSFSNSSSNQYGGGTNEDYSNPIISMPQMSNTNPLENRLLNSGKKSSKRSVSETKKKFVASRQNWRCGHCDKQLTAWFEVDHKIRLEYGGSNHIDNLVALCRECHGEKTTIENL